MKILLKIPLNPQTGYGLDGIGLTKALLNRGHTVALDPMYVRPPLPRDIANLLTEYHTPPFDIAIHHVSPGDMYLDFTSKPVSRINIAWSMWEWKQYILPAIGADTFQRRVELYDHFIVYDDGSKDALSPYTPVEPKVVQGGYDSSQWRTPDMARRDEETDVIPTYRKTNEDAFVFGMVGDLTPRKNPVASIKAYLKLKELHGDAFKAILVLKSKSPILPPSIQFPGVITMLESWSHAEMQLFYWNMDCLLAPSWGEGKNLPALEAATSGVPLILSDCPGHKEWASPDCVRFVHGDEAKLDEGLVGTKVEVDDLADAMWDVYTNQSDWRSKARAYAHSIPAMMDWEKAVTRLGLSLGLPL